MKTILITLFWWMVGAYVFVRIHTDRKRPTKKIKDRMVLLPASSSKK